MERFINFFGCFIPHLSDKLRHINQLRKTDRPFEWTDKCQRTFELLKKELSTSPVAQPYSLDKPTVVVTDASETAIAAVLMQENHPVFYVSCSLSPAEQRYPNVEREALAIVWALGRLRQFLLGLKFEIVTDHKPMEVLFGENRQLPKFASARIMNWATRTMHYDYVIHYHPGTEIPHVDVLTRLKFSSSKNECLPNKEHIESVINSVAFEKSLLPVEEVRAEYYGFLKRIVSLQANGLIVQK